MYSPHTPRAPLLCYLLLVGSLIAGSPPVRPLLRGRRQEHRLALFEGGAVCALEAQHESAAAAADESVGHQGPEECQENQPRVRACLSFSLGLAYLSFSTGKKNAKKIRAYFIASARLCSDILLPGRKLRCSFALCVCAPFTHAFGASHHIFFSAALPL